MTDPTKVERLEVWRCPVCKAQIEIAEAMRPPICRGWIATGGHHKEVRCERIEVIPAQEVERLEQALRELVEAVSTAEGSKGMDFWAAWQQIVCPALSQAREILGGSDG